MLLLKWSTSQDTCTVDVSRFLGKTPCTRIKSVMRTSSCTSELHWSQALCDHAINGPFLIHNRVIDLKKLFKANASFSDTPLVDVKECVFSKVSRQEF